MTRKYEKERYTITEDDAFHIESLIELLAMAIWEILRDKRQDAPPLDDDDDPFVCLKQFKKDTMHVIIDPPF